MIFLVNAIQVFKKGAPKNFIPDTFIGWMEGEKLSHIVGHTP